MLVQPDGRIVLAGGSEDFALTRLTVGGAVDETTFERADFGGLDVANAAALQPDGKIIVAGSAATQQPGISEMAVARYHPDGSLDTSFGGGKRTFGAGEFAGAFAVQAQPDGKIVVAGLGGVQPDFAVTRLNADGTLDPTFGAGGTSAIDFGGAEGARAVALQPDGKIVVTGIALVTQDEGDFAVARLQPGGALDTTFSADGKTTVHLGGSDAANAVALQPDGRILLAGYTQGVVNNIALARLEGVGVPDVVNPPGGGPGPGSGPGGPSSAPRCAGKRATIVGTAGRDRLRGTRRADVIVALGGDDRVSASAGHDVVCGGAGADRLRGQSGRDRLLGGRGADRLIGGRGRDGCRGGPGRDRVACEPARAG